MLKLTVPQEIYKSDRACAELIIALRERRAKYEETIEAIKVLEETAKDVMLTRLEATGLKNMNFEGIGIFKKSTSDKIAFPKADDGGKETAVKWLEQALSRGIITPAQLLDLQQARLVTEPVLAIEQAVADYNMQQQLSGSTDLMPDSPFNHFTQTTLSAPRTRKPA